VLSGACGHVYGTHSVWQFHDLEKRAQQTDARTPWQKAIDLPGAAQMGVMRKFFEGLDWTNLRRDDSFVLGGPQKDPAKKPMAAVAENRAFAVVYMPVGVPSIRVDPKRIIGEGGSQHINLIDPATGRDWGRLEKNEAYSRPANHTGDWVLLIRGAKS